MKKEVKMMKVTNVTFKLLRRKDGKRGNYVIELTLDNTFPCLRKKVGENLNVEWVEGTTNVLELRGQDLALIDEIKVKEQGALTYFKDLARSDREARLASIITKVSDVETLTLTIKRQRSMEQQVVGRFLNKLLYGATVVFNQLSLVEGDKIADIEFHHKAFRQEVVEIKDLCEVSYDALMRAGLSSVVADNDYNKFVESLNK